ncbi:MAG TPA: DUF4397 domain-containing protein [Rudaea sp.]
MISKFGRLAQILLLLCTVLPCAVTAATRARVAHFAPFANDVSATAVNITLNGNPLLSNVKFGDFTDYLALPGAGTYQIAVTPVGATSAAITQSVTVADNTDYTIAAIGDATQQPLELLAIVDDNATPPAGSLKLRVVHAAPFAASIDSTNVSIRTSGGDVVGGLSRVPYKGVSDVLTLPAGTYHLKVATPDGSANLIDAAPAALPAGASVTVFAIGDIVHRPLGLTALPVGALALQTPVDRSVAGAWYNPATSGQGFTFVPVPSQNRLWGTWYTYDADGKSQVWYSLDTLGTPGTTNADRPGTFDNKHAVFAVTKTTGGVFNTGAPVTSVPAGELDVTFNDCNAASATYINGSQSLQIPLTNLTPAPGCTVPAQ